MNTDDEGKDLIHHGETSVNTEDQVIFVKMVSPEHHWFLMKRPDGTRYKTVYQKDTDPVSYDVHRLYTG